jgi:hypothetical protein
LEILRRLEITKPSLLQDIGHRQPEEILGLVFFGHTQSWMEEDRLSGYVIKNLQPDGAPAPTRFQELANFWLSTDAETREEISRWYFYSKREAAGLADDMGTSTEIVKAALKLVNQDPHENHLLAWLDI